MTSSEIHDRFSAIVARVIAEQSAAPAPRANGALAPARVRRGRGGRQANTPWSLGLAGMGHLGGRRRSAEPVELEEAPAEDVAAVDAARYVARPWRTPPAPHAGAVGTAPSSVSSSGGPSVWVSGS
jgi:hypothetical protein